MYKITPARPTIPTARRLAQTCGFLMVNPLKEPLPSSDIINWGRTRFDLSRPQSYLLNSPNQVRLACDKLLTLISLQNIGVPWTIIESQAQQWLAEGHKVIARTRLNSWGGDGIVLMKEPSDFVAAPLYTRYLGRRTEYRGHVIGENFFVTQRKLRNGVETPNWVIRSHNNGWIHARHDISIPEGLENMARRAISSLGLEFGAVDLAHSERFGLRVLEVNTAPGLVGEALDFYVASIQSMLQ